MAILTTPRLGIPYPDGTERVTDGDNAMAAIATAVDQTGLPYRQALGTANPSMNNSGGINVAVTFPAGRFTQAPIVTASVAAGSNNYFASVYGATTTGFALYVSHRDNTATNTAILCNWHAAQALPGSPVGRALPAADDFDAPLTVSVTCQTEGCDNAGVAIDAPATVTDLDGEHEIGGYVCGVCGEPITDVAQK